MELRDKILTLIESDDDVDHSIDLLFGLNYEEVERSIATHIEGTYSLETLDSRALLTSYQDFYHILKELPPEKICADLGSGYSRFGILSEYLNMGNIHSYEFVEERVLESKNILKNLNLSTDKIIQGDLNQVDLYEDIFFVYLPVNETLLNILGKIRSLISKKEITLIAIESHGDLIPFLSKIPWLSVDKKITTKSERHDQYIYFFKSLSSFQDNIYNQLIDLSFDKNKEFVIKDFDIEGLEYWWLGSTYKALPSVKEQHLELKYPDRLVPISCIKEVIDSPLWAKSWREMRFKNQNHELYGSVKKIIIKPEKTIEFGKEKRRPT